MRSSRLKKENARLNASYSAFGSCIASSFGLYNPTRVTFRVLTSPQGAQSPRAGAPPDFSGKRQQFGLEGCLLDPTVTRTPNLEVRLLRLHFLASRIYIAARLWHLPRQAGASRFLRPSLRRRITFSDFRFGLECELGIDRSVHISVLIDSVLRRRVPPTRSRV